MLQNEEQDEANFISNLAYQAPKERQSFLDKSKFMNDFFIDADANHKHHVSVHSKRDHKIYIGHRGTVNAKDVLTDAYLASGRLASTDRYKESSQLSKNVHEQYNKTKDIVEVGHSLGGTLADQIARQHGGRSIAFNMGATPLSHYGKNVSEQHQHIRTDNDPVSHFSSGATKTIKHPKRKLERTIDALEKTMPSGPVTKWKGTLGIRAASALLGHSLSNFSGAFD